MKSYIEIVEMTETDFVKTGFCEEYQTLTEARRFFEVRRELEVRGGQYCMDLYKGPDDLIDTIIIDETGFKKITDRLMPFQRRQMERCLHLPAHS